jgi:hypothetical protein
MLMRDRTVLWGMIIVAATMLACNAFAGQRDPLLPPPPSPAAGSATITSTTTGSTTTAPTSLPGLAPTVTLPALATPAEGQRFVRVLVDLNIRAGPGVRFDRVGFLLRDERVRVLGRDPQSGWWRIECPPDADGTECWVSGGSQFTRPEGEN